MGRASRRVERAGHRAVNYAVRWSKDIDDHIEQNLPDEAKMAFAIRCDELEAWPWGTGGLDLAQSLPTSAIWKASSNTWYTRTRTVMGST